MAPVLGKIIKTVLKGQDSSLRACGVWHKLLGGENPNQAEEQRASLVGTCAGGTC